MTDQSYFARKFFELLWSLVDMKTFFGVDSHNTVGTGCRVSPKVLFPLSPPNYCVWRRKGLPELCSQSASHRLSTRQPSSSGETRFEYNTGKLVVYFPSSSRRHSAPHFNTSFSNVIIVCLPCCVQRSPRISETTHCMRMSALLEQKSSEP